MLKHCSQHKSVQNTHDGVAHAAEIFTEYGDFIRTVISFHVKNETQADDLFQDFFLSLVYKPLPKSVNNINSYLYRAITNDIVDATRRTEKYKTRIEKYSEKLSYSINNAGHENAVDKEELDRVFALIKGRLRNSESQAITLRYNSQHNIQEVAEKMGVKRTSVSRYISEGLRKIRKSLEPV